MDIVPTLIIALIGYGVVLLGLGYLAFRLTGSTPVDYFLGGRTVGAFAMIFTLSATYHSAFYFFGLPGFHFLHGFPVAPAAIGMSVAMVLSTWLFLPRFNLVGRAFGYITPADYLSDYYQSKVMRLVVGLMTVLYLVPYLSIQTIGISVGLESLTQGAIPYGWGAFVFLVVVMTYVLFGGFRAVVWTDVLQGIIFAVLAWVVGLWFLIDVAQGDLGGAFSAVAEKAPENMNTPGGTGQASYQWIFNFWLIFGLAAAVHPQLWQRGYAAASFRLFPIILIGVPILAVLGQLPHVISGVVGKGFVEGVPSPDALVPHAMGMMAGGLGVVVMIAAFAAAMSTSDSVMLSASSALTEDLYRKFVDKSASDRALARIGQAFVVAFAVVAFWVALAKPGLIIGFTRLTSTGFAMLIPIVLGSFHWPRGNRAGALAGLIGGNIVDLVLVVYVWPSQTFLGWHFGLYGIATCTILYVVVSQLTQPLPDGHLERFHELFRKAYGRPALLGRGMSTEARGRETL